MPQIDNFASLLLEEAKRFLEKARSDASEDGQPAYLHAALMLAFCSLEAHINAIADDEHTVLTAHERGLLKEKAVRLEEGEFKITQSRQISRLEDRMQFLLRKFGDIVPDRSLTWWSDLRAASDLRNQLTHPKGLPLVSEKAVERALQAIIEAIDAVYKAVYKKGFPAAGRGLRARLDF